MIKKNEIIPAILVDNWTEIKRQILLIAESQLFERVQIDICDGQFVPYTTWPFVEKKDFFNFDNAKINFENNKDSEIYVPEWDKLNYSADLMCLHPYKYLHSLLAFGFDNFIIHFRTLNNAIELQEIEKFCNDYLVELTLAIDIKTDVQRFIDFMNNFKDLSTWKSIQIMGIKEIGKQGEKLDKQIPELIQLIKNNFPDKIITIDGGVNKETINTCKAAGADQFVVGSALPEDNLDHLKESFYNLIN